MFNRIGMNNKLYRSLIFFSVYMVEMIVTMVTLSYFPAIFPMYGIDPRIYGFFGGLSLIPVTLKFIFGPISDKFPIPGIGGKRKGYIIIGAILNIIFLPFLSVNPATFFVLFFFFWFMQTLGIAIMDILTDALAIQAEDLQNSRGRTEVSVIMFFGTFAGGYIVSQFIPMLISNLRLTLVLFSIISIIPVGLILFLKEREETESVKQVGFIDAVKQGFAHPFVWWGLLFAFLQNLDGGLLELTLEPYLVDLVGVPWAAQIVVQDLFYISMIGYVLAFAGFFFIDRVKKNRVLIIITIFYMVPLGILGYLTMTSTLTYNTFLWLYGSLMLAGGLSFVTVIGLFFDLSSPKVAGTMIAVFYTVNNLGRLLGIMTGGFFTISTIFFISLGIMVLRILPLWKINMTDVEKEFYERPKREFKWTDILIVAVPIAFVILTVVLNFL